MQEAEILNKSSGVGAICYLDERPIGGRRAVLPKGGVNIPLTLLTSTAPVQLRQRPILVVAALPKPHPAPWPPVCPGARH